MRPDALDLTRTNDMMAIEFLPRSTARKRVMRFIGAAMLLQLTFAVLILLGLQSPLRRPLRLDSVEAINKGSEHGVVLVPGKPEESSFYKLLVLPKDDPDIMPAKGDQLTEEQTKAVFDWITEGANFGDWKAEEAAPAASGEGS